ncbi:hypothetical protein B0H11DRAFT_68189 [Mycena galericulata]|nr:hypothetical protein B0H11DRAFT_68189 [Mycena galericulata]
MPGPRTRSGFSFENATKEASTQNFSLAKEITLWKDRSATNGCVGAKSELRCPLLPLDEHRTMPTIMLSPLVCTFLPAHLGTSPSSEWSALRAFLEFIVWDSQLVNVTKHLDADWNGILLHELNNRGTCSAPGNSGPIQSTAVFFSPSLV